MHTHHHRAIGVLLAVILYVFIIQFPVCAFADMEISYLGIDQGNAVLIQCDSNTMLIDTGTNETAAILQNYLTTNAIKKIDILVTNLHAGNIDGVDSILSQYDIGSIMLAKSTDTMSSFDDVLTKISEKGIAIAYPTAKDTFQLGDAVITILAPASGDPKFANFPLAMRIDYGKQSFLFPGDMGLYFDDELLLDDSPLKADVLMVIQQSSSITKINHFIEAVSPKYAILSWGDENEDDQSQAETLTALTQFGIEQFRTDENGTITIKTDGESLDVITSNGSKTDGSPDASISYVGNKNSKKFHLTTCNSLPAEKNQVILETREKAIKQGYVPCKRCKP